MDVARLTAFVPFNSLSSEALVQAGALLRERRLDIGQTLFRRGDNDADRYYLLEGRMSLDSGDAQPALLIHAGSEAARHPLARLKPRRYTAIAQSGCHLAVFAEEALDSLLAQDQITAYEVQEFESNDPYWLFDLLRNPAFSRVPPANLHTLFKRFHPQPVKAGEVVIHQGAPVGDFYYLIREGRARVSRHNDAGQEVVLAHLGPGDSFGEEALISHAARNATVTMESEGLVMCLSAEDFDTLLKEPLVRHVDITEASALLQGGKADLIDVRLDDEFRQGNIKGSFNIPLCLLRLKAGTLSRERTHILVCETELRSSIAAFLLAQRGLDARVLTGGLDALRRHGGKTLG